MEIFLIPILLLIAAAFLPDYVSDNQDNINNHDQLSQFKRREYK